MKILDIVVKDLVAVLEDLLLGGNLLIEGIQLFTPVVELVGGPPDEKTEERQDHGGTESHVGIESHAPGVPREVRQGLCPGGQGRLPEQDEIDHAPRYRSATAEKKPAHRVEQGAVTQK